MAVEIENGYRINTETLTPDEAEIALQVLKVQKNLVIEMLTKLNEIEDLIKKKFNRGVV